MFIQNYLIKIYFLIFVLVVQICNTTTQITDEEINNQNFDEINYRSNTENTTPLPEVSKETMDIITIIWYLSTFLALAAFFFLMACSDRRCGRNNRRSLNNPLNNPLNNNDQQCPPTPSPSYSQFAPPTYESVIKDYNCNHIYVVPIDLKISNEKTNNNTFSTTSSSTATTDCKIHSIK